MQVHKNLGDKTSEKKRLIGTPLAGKTDTDILIVNPIRIMPCEKRATYNYNG